MAIRSRPDISASIDHDELSEVFGHLAAMQEVLGMSVWFSKSVLLLAALFCLFTAASSGVFPRQFANQLGLSILGASGYNEIRAQYAGFFLIVATVCVAALAGYIDRRSVYIVLAVVFGGLIMGRVVSLVVNRGFEGYTSTILALYAVDATGLLLALVAIAVDHEHAAFRK